MTIRLSIAHTRWVVALASYLVSVTALAQQNIPLMQRNYPPQVMAALDARIKQAAAQSTPRNAAKRPILTGYWEIALPEGSPFAAAADLAPADPNEIRVFKATEPLEEGNARMRAGVAARRANTSLRPRYKPEHAAKAMANFDAGDRADPTFGCRLPGVQRLGLPKEIFEGPDALVLLYADMITAYGSNRFRVVRTDGSQHDPDAEPMVMGYAIGHWEGDTLVVVTKGFTDDTWIDHDGSFHSEAMVYTERFTRRGNALFYEAVVEDPYFIEPFKIPAQTMLLATKGTHIVEEYPCIERSGEYIVNGEKH